jgi:hypothetical protein
MRRSCQPKTVEGGWAFSTFVSHPSLSQNVGDGSRALAKSRRQAAAYRHVLRSGLDYAFQPEGPGSLIVRFLLSGMGEGLALRRKATEASLAIISAYQSANLSKSSPKTLVGHRVHGPRVVNARRLRSRALASIMVAITVMHNSRERKHARHPAFICRPVGYAR